MQFKWIIWTVFCTYVSGATILRLHGHEKDNTTKNAISSSSDDYDTNYPDYTDRDYPNLDYYYDSRRGRSFNHNHDNPSEDGGNVDEQDAEDFMMKQLKSTIPGTPGVDYALYQSVPETSFRCETQASPGFYGDVEAQCQVFHICQEDDRHDSFLCPLGTVFNQISFICDWWFNFNCEDTPTFYYLNNRYDSSTGSTFMKDTVKRMKKIHNNEMHKMMGFDEVNTKIHNMKNMRGNTESIKLSKSPIKNLFMLGMRNKKFENIRNVITTKREAENFVTAFPVIRTPQALQAMSSTGNFDIALSENTTKTSLGGFHEHLTTETTGIAKENIDASDVPSTTVSAVLNNPFNSTNLSRIEMVINGSTAAEIKLDYIGITHNETNTTEESLSTVTDTHTLIKTEKISLPEVKPRKINMKVNKFEDDVVSYFQTEYPPKWNPAVLPNEATVDNNSKSNAILEKQSIPTILPLSKPFSQENKFIIGNDTHISVSVTIHSKSGNSKLQWKRLPGLKRIRKIRFKDENTTSTPEKHAANDAIYRKKNNEQKSRSRSRIMWIPAKRNILDQKSDWNSWFESMTKDTASNSKNETRHTQTLNEFKKAAIQSTEIPQIIIKGAAYDRSDPETRLMNKSMEFELSEESNTDQATKYTENNFSLATSEENFQQFNETSNFTNSNLENLSKTHTNSKNNSNVYSEIENNCKTICIKLLKSLDKNSMRDFGNNTDFENLPSSMFLTSESSHTQNQDEYQRKSILEFSPSEQWTLKYDSGPNCSENTEDDKILVKGWSVIIDIGSITKEKTVKRRSCTSSSNDKRIVLKDFNFVRNSQDDNAAFHPKTSHHGMNSNSRLGSADQRYWINLVRNWLSQPQSNKNQEINSMERDKYQNTYSNSKQMFDENADSKISNYQDPVRIRSEYLHQKILPERYQTNFNQNFELNSEAESDKIRVEDTLIPEYKRRRPQKVHDSTKTISFPDLQTERSDWSHATQRRQDRSDIVSNKRDSNDYKTQVFFSDEIDEDVISDETGDDEDRLAEDTRKRTNNFENSQTNRNSWMSEYQNTNRNSNMRNQWADRTNRNADQDYDDRSSQRRLARRNWMNIRRDEEPNIKSEEWDWSEKKQQNKEKAMPLPDRNMWSAEPNNDWLNDKTKTGMSNTNKGLQLSFVDRTNDWSGRNRNKQSSDTDNQPSVSWQQDFDRKSSDEQHKARSPNSMTDVKGKSVPDVWSMIKHELKTHFMKRNPSDGWSLMKASDTSWSADKKVPRRNDRTFDSEQNKSSLSPPSTRDKHPQTSKNDKAFWSTDEENNWGTDSEPKWVMENQKGDKEWRKPAVKHVGGTMKSRNDWYTEESAWNWEEQASNKPLNKDWNLKSTSNKKKGISPGTEIKPGNIPDWSSMAKTHQNKGYATKGKELPTRPSQKHPSWTDDEEDDVWPAKSPRSESWPSDHALNRMNFKGNSNFKTPRAPSTSGKSGNSNGRNKWRDDEEARIVGFPDNRPDQKQDKGISSKPRMKYPQWKSEFIDSEEWLEAKEKRTQSRIPNNSKGADFPQGTSRSDNGGTARKRMADWENEPWNDGITLTKDIKVQDRNLYQPHRGRNNQRNEKTDAVSWSMHRQTDSLLSGYGRASQKPNLNNNWRSSKDIKGSRAPESASPNVNDQSESVKPRKNSARNESDSYIKSIVWSAQISDDGKLANGWTPITLRPDLKNRVNGSQTGRSNKRTSLKNSDWIDDKADSSKEGSADDDSKSNRDKMRDDKGQEMRNFSKNGNWRNGRKGQNNKGSSSMEDRNRYKSDCGSEDSFFLDESRNLKDRRITNQNSGVSKNNQNTRIAKHAEIIEIDPLTIHTPEATFKHLIYIPPKSTRNKRSYKSKDRQKKIRDRVNRSYIIIKNGKILNDTSKNIDKVFISQADTTVRDDRVDETSDSNLNIQKLSFQNNIKQNSSTLELNEARILKRNDAMYETNAKHSTTTIESIIREIWSSPFISTNFSASGWIPVTTFKSSTDKNVPNLNKNDKIINVRHFQGKTDGSSLNAHTSILVTDQFTADSESKNLSITDSDTKNKEISENKNRTSTAKSENVEEMKVGNETLRILSFSDVMKQFQNQDKLSEDYKQDDKLWNKPITINPKTYSIKLNDPPKETAINFKSSWNFTSNENNTKKPWMLIRNGDNLNTNVKDKKVDQNPDDKNIDVSKINMSMIDQLSNSTLSFSANKTHSTHFKFTSWNANSNWTPVIRTAGRVISYNRTLLSR